MTRIVLSGCRKPHWNQDFFFVFFGGAGGEVLAGGVPEVDGWVAVDMASAVAGEWQDGMSTTPSVSGGMLP